MSEQLKLSFEIWPNMPWGRLEIAGPAWNSWGDKSIEWCIRQIASYGYEGFDVIYPKIQEIRPHEYDDEVKRIRKAMDETGLEFSSIGCHTTFVSPRYFDRDAGIAKFKRAIDAASDMGAGTVVTLVGDPGWIEQEPEVWWEAAVHAIRNCWETTNSSYLAAVSLSGHMSATVLVDEDGIPIMPSIMIADTRSWEQTKMLRETLLERFVSMTGNEPLDAFSVSKLLWVKHQRPELMRSAAALLFPKDYIRFKLTGEIGTDPSDAGNSLLYDYAKQTWDKELAGELGIDPGILPDIHQSGEIVGMITREAAASTGLPKGTPVVTGAADMA